MAEAVYADASTPAAGRSRLPWTASVGRVQTLTSGEAVVLLPIGPIRRRAATVMRLEPRFRLCSGVAPVWLQRSGGRRAWCRRHRRDPQVYPRAGDVDIVVDLRDHVVIVSCGRSGGLLAERPGRRYAAVPLEAGTRVLFRGPCRTAMLGKAPLRSVAAPVVGTIGSRAAVRAACGRPIPSLDPNNTTRPVTGRT